MARRSCHSAPGCTLQSSSTPTEAERTQAWKHDHGNKTTVSSRTQTQAEPDAVGRLAPVQLLCWGGGTAVSELP